MRRQHLCPRALADGPAQAHRRSPAGRGFTLIELLVVIAVILILIGILVPVIGAVRGRAKAAETSALLMKVANAITAYEQEFRAYPGPLPNDQVYADTRNTAGPDLYHDTDANGLWDDQWANPLVFQDVLKVTASENLVLGLLGGLRPVQDGTATWHIGFDPAVTQSGRGPTDLAVVSNPGAQPKQFPAYLQGVPLTPGNGHYSDDAGHADDTVIPEILDRFTNPMPLLYLRARRGAQGVVSQAGYDTQSGTEVIGMDNNVPPQPIPTQYDLSDVLAYTRSYSGNPGDLTAGNPLDPGMTCIGVGKDLPLYFDNSAAGQTPPVAFHGLRTVIPGSLLSPPGTGYYFPYDGHAYLQNPTQPPYDIGATPPVYGTPRQKDGFILISAGEDRVYGTDDDITNFGSVAQ